MIQIRHYCLDNSHIYTIHSSGDFTSHVFHIEKQAVIKQIVSITMASTTLPKTYKRVHNNKRELERGGGGERFSDPKFSAEAPAALNIHVCVQLVADLQQPLKFSRWR